MPVKTTSNAAGLFHLESELRKCLVENHALRQYRKRARRSYRTLQAAYNRVMASYLAQVSRNDWIQNANDTLLRAAQKHYARIQELEGREGVDRPEWREGPRLKDMAAMQKENERLKWLLGNANEMVADLNKMMEEAGK